MINTTEKTRSVADELTGLCSRYSFYEQTEALLDAHPDRSFCLMYWNIRKFKVINNLFGFDSGDNLLIYFSELLKRTFGEEGSVYGRMNSDNFSCCVSSNVVKTGRWKKLCDMTCKTKDSEYHFYAYCGLYFIHDRAQPVQTMVDKAYVAMMRVRNDYITPWAVFDESMWSDILSEEKLMEDFRRGLENRQFKVYYQPICRANDGAIVGAEALVRWEHPEQGLLLPGAFISHFEKNGFINLLDNYVWNEVGRMQKERLEAGKHVLPVSVNVSRMGFYNPKLCENIHHVVKFYKIPASLLHIEITESAYVDDPERVNRAIRKLHEYGFTVLMDDFGNGYSSLNILKNLPVDIIKIDREFMADFNENPKVSIILEAIIHMAKKMGLGVVAEGVEDREVWKFLKKAECDHIQGFYFYRPVQEDVFNMILDEHTTD